tara:strand:+ start:2239 stop:2421 length:183 start_codon:yes stop_codon:yes gene_type:complete
MMSKMKRYLEEREQLDPNLYNGHAEEEFWMQCRLEEILEREGQLTVKVIKKGVKKCQKKK